MDVLYFWSMCPLIIKQTYNVCLISHNRLFCLLSMKWELTHV